MKGGKKTMNKQEEEFEEFEEFEDGEDDEEDDTRTTIPEDDEEEEVQEVVEAPKKKVVVKKTPVKAEVPETKAKPTSEPQIQYVGVPRAVTMEEMMNKVFDDIQELKQMVNALLTKDE